MKRLVSLLIACLLVPAVAGGCTTGTTIVTEQDLNNAIVKYETVIKSGVQALSNVALKKAADEPYYANMVMVASKVSVIIQEASKADAVDITTLNASIAAGIANMQASENVKTFVNTISTFVTASVQNTVDSYFKGADAKGRNKALQALLRAASSGIVDAIAAQQTTTTTTAGS